MNPVVIAAIAISLVSLGAVSMASIASQQAVSSASLQKAILERDRLSEQVNAFISSVAPSGPDTVVTVRNTGSAPVTIDHCFVLSHSDGGNPRPAATKVPGVSGSTVNPGSAIEITIAGAVTGDSIKCVTSKGTVLPVKMDGGDGSTGPDPDDYISIYGVTASVSMAQTVYKHNLRNQPWGAPAPPQQPPGSLTYNVPVLKPVTVNYIARVAPDDSIDVVLPDGSGVHYSAGQKIPVPVRGPVSKITIKFTPDDLLQSSSKLEVSVRPLLVSSIASVAGNSGVAATSSSDYYDEVGVTGCWYGSNSGRGIRFYGGNQDLFGSSLISANVMCTNSGYTGYYYIGSATYWGYSTPEIVQTYSFPAPKETITVEVPYSISYWGCGHCTTSATTIRTTLYLDPGDGNYRLITSLNNDFNSSLRQLGTCTNVDCVGYASPTSPTLPSFRYTLSNVVPGETVKIAIKYKADTEARQDSRLIEKFGMSTTVNIY
ncbi:MAG: hypothetical protein HRF40_06995 [Nitrososphaera sp.]|jgi:archaellum component FlaG (FlaF/FlaG flagellin family)